MPKDLENQKSETQRGASKLETGEGRRGGGEEGRERGEGRGGKRKKGEEGMRGGKRRGEDFQKEMVVFKA